MLTYTLLNGVLTLNPHLKHSSADNLHWQQSFTILTLITNKLNFEMIPKHIRRTTLNTDTKAVGVYYSHGSNTRGEYPRLDFETPSR